MKKYKKNITLFVLITYYIVTISQDDSFFSYYYLIGKATVAAI